MDSTKLNNKAVNNRGVTMMELLIVIAIIGIMASFGAFSFQGMLTNSRLKQAIATVKSSITLARTKAMANPSVHCGIFFDATKNGVIVFYDDNSNNAYDATGTPDRKYMELMTLPVTLEIGTISSSTANCFVFRGDGSVKDSGSVQIIQKNGTRYKRITVTKQSGEVTVTP